MTPKEFQKSNLAMELKAGKKRREDALHGLSDEQCERAGASFREPCHDPICSFIVEDIRRVDPVLSSRSSARTAGSYSFQFSHFSDKTSEGQLRHT
jgi:hypothetical protein